MEELEYIQVLFEKWAQGAATPEEESALSRMVDAHSPEELLPLLEAIAARTDPDPSKPASYWDNLYASLLEKTRATKPARIRAFPFWRAAAAILILALGTYFYFTHAPGQHQPSTAAVPHDVQAPAANRATITLANGRKLFLDSATNGQLATQGSAQLIKLANGQITYQTNSRLQQPPLYNTLFNPRGSRVITITLSDGTRVWLNAESSIRYPAVFTSADRIVEIDGEAYLEVSPDKNHPFRVRRQGMEVQVLGTSFNVHAYGDEPELKITLLQGAIRVITGQAGSLLQPGQQARIRTGKNAAAAGITIDPNPDLEQTMAWKNGLFNFNNADIREILRQTARWYDLDIVYQGRVTDERYRGAVSRESTLSQVLKILELNKIKFNIEGKKLTIL